MKKTELKNLIKFRHLLHSEPELSGKEKNTSKKIIEFISQFSPDQIIKNIGGNGVAFIFKGEERGPTILFRCELDALPIEEINDFSYKSKVSDVGHKCGHDGHMTILCGLAQSISRNGIKKGKAVLLFQPAEETGEGAEKVLNDKKFSKIKPDYVFALHNLPGYPLHTVILRKNTFAATSKGMIIKLKGKTSHAGEPEKGINPSCAVADIIKRFSTLISDIKDLKDFCLVTVIHVRIGERAFGTSAGYAEVMVTFRSNLQDDMNLMTDESEKLIKKISQKEKLKYEISYTEEFPPTINDDKAVDMIARAADENKLKTKFVKNPFRWTEDFGHFTDKYQGALFGLGSGVKHPKLHNPDYDFPDEIISSGINIFASLINIINNKD